MRVMRWALPALTILFFTGCFQTVTLIRVNRDGSGTLEERFLLGNRFADMLRSMSPSDEASDATAAGPEPAQPGVPDPQMVDVEKLRARAAAMGYGVELETAEPLASESGAGYRAVFRFPDINLLELRFDPGESLAEASGEENTAPEPIRFRFTRGPTPGLEILLPETGQEQQSPGTAAAGGPEDSTLHMLRQVYGDMKIRLALEVNGRIIESNAAYREGSTVTLLDLDFGRLMQDEEAFRRMAAAQPRGLEDMAALAAGNPALKIQTGSSVLVRFK
jgi:hypothetical protein